MDISDEIELQQVKREAEAFALNHALGDVPIVIAVPDCSCNAGLDDSTNTLHCPDCKREAREEAL